MIFTDGNTYDDDDPLKQYFTAVEQCLLIHFIFFLLDEHYIVNMAYQIILKQIMT